MQRDNAAHAVPDAPANDSRDTPLNRLLRKPGPAPDAPATPSPPAPEAAAGKPAGAPQPAPKPAAASLSPAEMIVNKLRSKQAPTPLARPEPPRAPVSVPEVVPEKPIDVDYTPVDVPAGKLLGEVGTAIETAARKPLPVLETSPVSAAAKTPPAHRPAVEAPIARPLPAQNPAAAPVEERLRQEPLPQAPAPQASVPQAPAEAPKQRPAAEPPVAVPPPPPVAPQEAVAAAPAQPQVPREEARFDKPPLGPISAPEGPADKPSERGTALERSLGRLLPARQPAAEKSASKLLALPRRTRDEREFLPAALEIVDTPPSPVGRAIGLTIILVAIIAIVWSIFGKVDIVATASGRIVPAGKTKIVQPADTGIVTGIHVADGDQVKAGDILIELNSNQVSADRDRFVRDLLQANLNLARLRGLAATLPGTAGEGQEPNLVDPPQDASKEDLALTLAAMRAQAANENAKLADLDQQIEAKRAEAAEAAANATKLQASLPMLADQEQLLRTMRDQKIGSKLDWYQVNQQLIEQKHEIGVLAHRREAAEAAQRALREQRAAEATQFQMAILSELDKVRAQASELNAELAKSQQRVSQNVLLAPIDGTVQQLAIHTIGGVVTPAESLLAIVPHDDSLVVEAAVQNRDVGFISEGQTVRVKVEAFNFTLYGLIEGKVLSVTRDAVAQSNDSKNKNNSQNEGDPAATEGQSGPVYMARIALDQDWMMTENGRVALTPGMAVTAEIQTGERRLISYLLSPLVRHVSESMRER
jgi:hemolysin D